MEKWEKVITLHRLLKSSKYPLSLQEIIEELECSQATFYRIQDFYKNSLGAPIVYNKKYKGYILDESGTEPFELPGLWFTVHELEALICFQHIIQGLQPGFLFDSLSSLQPRIMKLLKAQRVPVERWTERIKIISIGFRSVNKTVFKQISEALLHKRQIQITYESLYKQEKTKRTISPQTLLHYRDNWYVDAWCHTRNELRTFSINRIAGAEIVKTKAKSIPVKELESHFADAYGIFSGKSENIAQIKLTGLAAKAVAQEIWHPFQKGENLPDGSYLLKLPYKHTPELVMDILRWGNNAEVIEPKHLREQVKNLLTATLKKYL